MEGVEGGTIDFVCSSSRRRHTRLVSDWSSDVCSSDLNNTNAQLALNAASGPWIMQGGAIHGGTVSTAEGAKLLFTTAGGTLDAVTVNEIGRATCRERV